MAANEDRLSGHRDFTTGANPTPEEREEAHNNVYLFGQEWMSNHQNPAKAASPTMLQRQLAASSDENGLLRMPSVHDNGARVDFASFNNPDGTYTVRVIPVFDW